MDRRISDEQIDSWGGPMTKITVEEARALKQRTEDAIKLALCEFEHETGMGIVDLALERGQKLGWRGYGVIGVKLKVRLP
jgi:hypothetical protein